MTSTQKIEDFIAGKWQNRYQYKSFEPTHINTSWIWEEPKINTMLERATKALGELNAFSLIVPDIDLFIQMHITKEAQTSSKIEGTQTQLDEALMPEEQIQPEKRDDWREVQNYIKAMNQAVDSLKTLPLSNRLLKETHHTLISGTRGREKLPGEFRSSQNWIGGSSLMDAAFIPPHYDNVAELMGDLELFWHNDEIFVPHLIRIAISHYQFETIHPFLDGNGRVGRLLIPLYLISHGVLEKPSFYISDFFERNRASYYDALMAVRLRNDLLHWVLFFLNGVEETAKKGCQTFRQILVLRQEMQAAVMAMGKRAEMADSLLKLLYTQPVQTAQSVEQILDISPSTANTLLKEFEKAGILQEITGNKRSRMYAMIRYLGIF
ncbi:Fic family protein [Nicoletella semolina]|uniref:Protein adenylyltransferase n=1 Tax=Nicoletella semolina TaxID=271160 RepID=A0A4R2N6Y2_9PAST|nr:Fic family protein [Nicoletella semolina]MDH2924704.1 cell filamentation protein Fic [Nicoletella semolina]TCP16672.1 Fic family protein [Nicoletella semolina]